MSRISRMSESVRGVRPNWRIYCSLIIGSYQPIVPIRGQQTLLKIEKKIFFQVCIFLQCIHPSSHSLIFLQNRGDQTGFTLFFFFLKKALFFRNFFLRTLPPPHQYTDCAPWSNLVLTVLIIFAILLGYLHSFQLLFLSY